MPPQQIGQQKYNSLKTLTTLLKTFYPLLKDIISGQRGKFHKLFDKYLTVEMLDEIKNRFKNNPCVQDDITTTPDQIQTVDNEIKISQISYPEKISYTNVLSFLMKLHKLFNWDKSK